MAFLLLITPAASADLNLGLVPAPPAPAPCSATSTPGGDWPMYGHDLANTRAQSAEKSLGPLRAATLTPQWVFDTGHPAEVVGFVDINATPVVARGCVYAGDAGGDIFALDANTGALVWRRHIDLTEPGSGYGAGAVVGTVQVVGDRVVAVINQAGRPYLIALDARTGDVRWTSPPIDTQPGAYTHASPLVSGNVVFVGFSGPEGIVTAQGGFALFDLQNGQRLRHTFSIPEADQALGFGGGGIWSTPAVDESTGYAYVGTGNPFSKDVEHPRTNAIVKIDMNRARSTFGDIVASYKGDIDQFLPLLRDASQPTCELLPENPPLPPFPPFLPPLQEARDSIGCFQLDLDFGAAPNLFRDAGGKLLVGELQKSGVYHVVRADSMASERKIPLGVSCLVCNGSSTAYDASRGTVLADVALGTFMTSFRPTGDILWRSLVGDPIHYQPVAIADGVAYTVDMWGFLDAYDIATGLPVLRRPLLADGLLDAVGALASNGVSIANHTVYVAAGSRIAAYRPLDLLR